MYNEQRHPGSSLSSDFKTNNNNNETEGKDSCGTVPFKFSIVHRIKGKNNALFTTVDRTNLLHFDK